MFGKIIKAAKHGWKDGWNGTSDYRHIYFNDLEEPQEKPFYIDDQIEALIEQIRTTHQVIDRLTEQIRNTINIDKLVKLEKQKADTLYRVARLEEKLNKLLEKWD